METESTPDPIPTQSEAPATSRYAELKQLVAAMEGDFEKFYAHNNKAAGTRVRAAMQALKQFAQNVRNEVQTIKNEGGGGKPAAGGGGDDDAQS